MTRRRAMFLMLVIGLALDVIGIVGFQTLGGFTHMVALVPVAIVQSGLIVIALWRVRRSLVAVVGLVESAFAGFWMFMAPDGAMCRYCGPPFHGADPDTLPLGGRWAFLALSCGLLTLIAAAVGPGKKRSSAAE